MVIDAFKGEQITVEDGDVGLQAHGHFSSVEADYAAADDNDVGWCNAGHTADQHTRAVGRLLQVVRPGEDGHPPGNLRHRLEQGQAAARRRHGLVGDAGRAGFDQVFCLFRVRGEVKVGVEHVVRAQHGALDGLWLLDLDDHLGGIKDLGRGGEDLRASVYVVLIGGTNAVTGSGFNDHVVTVADEFAHAVGGQTNPVFTVLDFLWNADAHTASSIHWLVNIQYGILHKPKNGPKKSCKRRKYGISAQIYVATPSLSHMVPSLSQPVHQPLVRRAAIPRQPR